MPGHPALGIVTIGQSPRTDVVPEMVEILGEVDILERGALDELDRDEISRLTPGGDDTTLVTRLRDGSSVVVGESRIVPLVEDAVAALEQRGVGATLLVCTGPFPPLRHQRPLLPADRLLPGAGCGGRASDRRGCVKPPGVSLVRSTAPPSGLQHVSGCGGRARPRHGMLTPDEGQ